MWSKAKHVLNVIFKSATLKDRKLTLKDEIESIVLFDSSTSLKP